MRPRALGFALLACAATTGGCTGTITGTDLAAPGVTPNGGPPGGGTGGNTNSGGTTGGSLGGISGSLGGISGTGGKAYADPGLAPLRRLTNVEYSNTVRDLLGDTTGAGQGFAPDSGRLTQPAGYDTVLVAHSFVGVDSAQQYVDAAEALAKAAVSSKLAALLPCNPATAGEDACAGQFVEAFGKRAYRSPLDVADKAALMSMYGFGKAQDGFAMGIQMVITAALSSPKFLYRVEIPRAASGIEGVSDYELASRLSYLLWRSMPDPALFAAAEGGKLRTADGLAVEAVRMLQDPKAAIANRSFYSQWYRLYAIDGAFKSPTDFPKWNTEIAKLMKTEAGMLFDDVLQSSSAPDVTKLLTATHTFANAKLAQYYGFPAVTGDAFARVDLEPRYAAGVLRLGAVQAGLAHVAKTAPFVRAKFMMDMVTCEPLPQIPPNADQSFVVTAAVTTRQVLEGKTASTTCQGCHSVMNPYAWAFESFDAAGKWRATENGQPVNTTSVIKSGELAGPVVGAVDLVGKIAASESYKECVAKQMFRYGMGRVEEPGDTFTGTSDLKQGFYSLVKSDAFRFRRIEEAL